MSDDGKKTTVDVSFWDNHMFVCFDPDPALPVAFIPNAAQLLCRKRVDRIYKQWSTATLGRVNMRTSALILIVRYVYTNTDLSNAELGKGNCT